MGTIAQVTVQALVVSKNSVQFPSATEPDAVFGKVMQVPCRDIRYDWTEMWAIPVKDSGIYTGLDFELKSGKYLNQPSYDSFTVTRIEDRQNNDYWIFYGTIDDLTTSCNTCCGDDEVPMPHVDNELIERIAPTEVLDIENDNGTPYMVFGIPTLTGSQRYYPYGNYQGVSLPSANPNGYSSIPLMLTFLNSTWNTFVWTVSADNLTLIATGGTADGLLGVNIIGINASA